MRRFTWDDADFPSRSFCIVALYAEAVLEEVVACGDASFSSTIYVRPSATPSIWWFDEFVIGHEQHNIVIVTDVLVRQSNCIGKRPL